MYVVGDDLRGLRFTVAVEDARHFARRYDEAGLAAVDDEDSSGRRRYITTQYQVRLHQAKFRERVLDAYREACSFCRLRHRELLDAAHIIPDADSWGDPVVPNGLALCKLHHAAFDAYFLTVTPDYRIEVRAEILAEHDGPMLVHGLKELHGQRMHTPRSQAWYPDPDRLAARYERFRQTVPAYPTLTSNHLVT